MVKQKNCIKKTTTFTIIDMDFGQEQLKSGEKIQLMVTKFCRNKVRERGEEKVRPSRELKNSDPKIAQRQRKGGRKKIKKRKDT